MQASSPLPPLSPRTKWLIALCLCVLVMLLEFLTYHMAYRIGYDEGMLTTPPVVVQKSDEKAMQNLSRFMADVFASRESLAGILDNREERLAWIRDPELRTETAWGLTRELISRGGVVPALPAARELIDAGYAAGRYYARVAQLVEHDLAKVGAAGSSPVSRSGKRDTSHDVSLFFVLLRSAPVGAEQRLK